MRSSVSYRASDAFIAILETGKTGQRFMIDYFRLGIALLPLGLYVLVHASLMVRKRPTLLNAGQETLLLGFALAGLVTIGPMELFFPNAAYAVLGEWTWLCLGALYFFIVLFIALNRRPSWTVIGLGSKDLKAVVERTLTEQKIDHQWLDNTLNIPAMGVLGIIESANRSDSTSSLSPGGLNQDPIGWYRLEQLVCRPEGLRAEFHRLAEKPSWGRAAVWYCLGCALLVVSIMLIVAGLGDMREWLS